MPKAKARFKPSSPFLSKINNHSFSLFLKSSTSDASAKPLSLLTTPLSRWSVRYSDNLLLVFSLEANKTIFKVWKLTSYNLVGETLWKGNSITKHINGITISPKKSFCIIKIWLSNCNHQNPASIVKIKGLNTYGCIFKKHKPEY